MSSLERTVESQGRAADALAALYRDHARLVAGICRGMLRDPEEAADAAQQSFLAAHRSLLAGTTPQEPAAWLATIARNECRMRIRKRMTAPLTVALDPEVDGRGDDTTHQAAVERASMSEVREAVAELPARQREALLLREVQGLSYDEVARTMDVSPPSVEALLWRARKTIAERVRFIPGVVMWAKDSLLRIGGPADAVSTAALAAKGGAALLAAITATSAAVEVKDRSLAAPAPIVATKHDDNSGPGSASSGRGSGRESDEADDSHRGRNRGRGSDDNSSGKGSGHSGSDDSD